MNQLSELNKIAKQMVQAGKGILAADESIGTIEKRFAKISLPSTEENRRAYREMLFTASGIGEYISGVIMFDETIRQSATGQATHLRQGYGGQAGLHYKDKSFIEILQEAGALPGIKVDQGTMADPSSPEEKLTKGLDGLSDRLKEYASLGAKFAKWRAVITIGDGIPTDANIRQNVKDLAAYALACQEAGLVPMVEPEVLMDGGHSIERCGEVSEQVLAIVFDELKNADVDISGVILKTNMVLPGKTSGQKALAGDIAAATIRVFKKVLPDNLPGQAFLSGGQSEIEATENLNAINHSASFRVYGAAMHQQGELPWQLTFSYGRALQDSALKIWNGDSKNVEAAQQTFLHRAKMNGLATLGEYKPEMENQ